MGAGASSPLPFPFSPAAPARFSWPVRSRRLKQSGQRGANKLSAENFLANHDEESCMFWPPAQSSSGNGPCEVVSRLQRSNPQIDDSGSCSSDRMSSSSSRPLGVFPKRLEPNSSAMLRQHKESCKTNSSNKRLSLPSFNWRRFAVGAFRRSSSKPSHRSNDVHRTLQQSTEFDRPNSACSQEEQQNVEFRQHGCCFAVVDSNQNYHGLDKSLLSSSVSSDLCSIDEELEKTLRFDEQQDVANNNLTSLLGPKADTPLSPVHHAGQRQNLSSVELLPHPAVNCRLIGGRHAALQSNGRTVVQASTSELLTCISEFLRRRFGRRLTNFDGSAVAGWLRAVDKSLVVQGWQEIGFVNPANLVFLFMLLREMFERDERELLDAGGCSNDPFVNVYSEGELRGAVLACLYLAYAYMGNEISYPAKPFLSKTADRDLFWSRCLHLVECHSHKMLLINADAAYFSRVFSELKQFSVAGSAGR